MKLTAKEIVEYAGTIAIVASLLFVGLQLQLDRKMALAEVYAARSESRQATLRSLLESDIATLEISKYREAHHYNGILAIPESWIDPEDPRITEARRIRNELLIWSLDNNIYQSSLGLFDIDSQRVGIRAMFDADRGLREFALRLPGISPVARDEFQAIANELDAGDL